MLRRLSYCAVAAMLTAACATSQAATPDLSSCDEWRPAPTCNFQVSSRPGSYPIQYVVIHKVQGSASSAASWFQNCAAGVTAHFIFNNTTGYCYQSVREKDIAWHAGNSTTNARSIGIEHGGFVANNDTANICYRESGLETKSCITYYSVTWDRSHIIGHNQVPGATHTDPGPNWNWNFYMSCANNLTGGAIRDKWLDLGGGPGFLGNPTTGELTTPDTIGRYNHFAGGSIYWTPSTGAHEVHGNIKIKWSQLGWETGICGYPTTDETNCPDGVGKFNHFSANNASIYWSPATGAHEVHGSIKNHWASLGWENSSLGYPTSDEYDIPGGKRTNFQGGTITYNSSTGVCTVP